MDTYLFNYIQVLLEEAHIITLFATLVFTLTVAPINKETVVITLAIMSGTGLISPFFGFSALVLANYISYFLFFFIGRFSKALQKLILNDRTSAKMEKRIDRSNQFIEKYGAMSIIFGYFVPGIRQVLPLIMGISTFKALRFMWIAFWGSIIWTGVYYFVVLSLTDLWI
ncbi:hypothetical protein SYNTR_0025 [Candidatus Syntrophocurvum alkaliphilum]|uniref:VTT domain-containing protein n=1 Tax=Candidatus Syntrophocurvum alkaliphilum TaxID=2293317 RepID=A0A6I6DDB4_9FIRM|nr:VTT domain-containing protein [Candidatus Syntrophocurvum alkaliphilum]QGT98618.1 hypothetical protein SYNTR_0025 [Candidatus Syntrophocurvum alkaliphilum]